MTDLADSCKALAALLPQARALTAQPDTSTVTGRKQPCSRPPWNGAAEYAATTPEEAMRRLEATFRRELLGHLGPRRSNSWGNTLKAIKAVEDLACSLPVRHVHEEDRDGRRLPCRCLHCRASRFVGSLCQPIEQLPAVDTSEPWRKVPGAVCPYCRIPMLYARPRALTVTCIRWGNCYDSNGQHPIGHMEISRISADPIVRWSDGLVAP